MKKTAFLFLFLTGALLASAQQKTEMKLWPDGPPETNGLQEIAHPDGTFARVTDPVLTVYLPEKERTGQAVVICPGGSYQGLAIQHEGHQVAQWLNTKGIAAVVLKYRMPNGNREIPGKDVRRAIEITRENAGAWNIDATKVGVMGFSAGGHLASTAATHYTSLANRPDFAVLIYPVITMDETLTHAQSRENLLGKDPEADVANHFSNERRISPDTPPVFIAFSDDDRGVDPRNGTRFYEAMKANDRPCELHIYPTGGHGWGWKEDFKYAAEVRTSLQRWLSERE